MPAKFTQGTSLRTTKSTRNFTHDPPEPKTHSVDGPRGGNTLNGMPGYIDAHQKDDMGHAKGGKGFGPHREGPVGERGSSGAKGMGKEGNAKGMTVKNYKSASTDSAGTLHGNSHMGADHVHTANRTHRMPGQKAPPTSRGILGGTIRAAGLDRGSGGKMEKLKARTSSEGRRKSMMY